MLHDLVFLSLNFFKGDGGENVLFVNVKSQRPHRSGNAGSHGRSRSPGEGNGNPLQRSRLENTVDRGAWQAAAHGIAARGT